MGGGRGRGDRGREEGGREGGGGSDGGRREEVGSEGGREEGRRVGGREGVREEGKEGGTHYGIGNGCHGDLLSLLVLLRGRGGRGRGEEGGRVFLNNLKSCSTDFISAESSNEACTGDRVGGAEAGEGEGLHLQE